MSGSDYVVISEQMREFYAALVASAERKPKTVLAGCPLTDEEMAFVFEQFNSGKRISEIVRLIHQRRRAGSEPGRRERRNNV